MSTEIPTEIPTRAADRPTDGPTGPVVASSDTAGLDRAVFREVMASVPTGVTIVTARDERGEPHGMTVGSFCSVSLDPPLILVSLDTSANCFPVFARCDRFAVSVLRREHVALARRFASKIADKFSPGGLYTSESGLPVVENALAVVECGVYDRHLAGDHVIVVGEVRRAWSTAGTPLVYVRRTFTAVVT